MVSHQGITILYTYYIMYIYIVCVYIYVHIYMHTHMLMYIIILTWCLLLKLERKIENVVEGCTDMLKVPDFTLLVIGGL